MAKRFVRFSQLANLGDFELFRAPNTFGAHGAIVRQTEDGRLAVTGLHSEAGQIKTAPAVFIKPGDTLGYEGGVVWRVKKPADYADPIRAVLAEARTPQRVLREGNPEDLRSQFRPEARVGDGRGGDFPSDVFLARPAGDVSALLCWKWNFRHGNFQEVVAVIVLPDCDRRAVANWLSEQITPQGRERATNQSRHRSVKNDKPHWTVGFTARERRERAAEKRAGEITTWLRQVVKNEILHLSTGEKVEYSVFAGEYQWCSTGGGVDCRHTAARFNPERLKQIAVASGQPLPSNLR
ncbi:MAG: hypothetical protein WC794_02880 [Candidatus Doudnabacteria bacterium]|jgi:hypothetical protein